MYTTALHREYQPYRFTVDQYHRMAEAGIVPGGLEVLDGVLYHRRWDGPGEGTYRFAVDDFHRMAELGVLGADDRIELIDGELILMTPIGPLHAICTSRICRILDRQLQDRAVVWGQSPVDLGARHEFYPDVAVLQPREAVYERTVPGPGDAVLVIEVADSTLPLDRTIKAERYARAGIAEYWIVNIPDRCVEVYRKPTGDAYADSTLHRADDALTVPGFADVSITPNQVFTSA